MQLRMLRAPLGGRDHDPRRHRPVVRARSRTRRWSDLVRYLAPDVALSVEELRLAYRVPAEVMELALPLLPLIAPDVAAADRLPRRETSRRGSSGPSAEHLVVDGRARGRARGTARRPHRR